jgi:hypothetical protein
MKLLSLRYGLITAAAAVAVLVGPPAVAAADDFDTCNKEWVGLALAQQLDNTIAACSCAIASGGYSGNNLAELYYFRGDSYRCCSDLCWNLFGAISGKNVSLTDQAAKSTA